MTLFKGCSPSYNSSNQAMPLGVGELSLGKKTAAVVTMPAVQVARVRSLGGEDPLEEDIATHSSVLA